MSNTRQAGVVWEIEPLVGRTYELAAIQVAVLQDLRDELQKLNRLLHCSNFTEIPGVLRAIRQNTTPKVPAAKRTPAKGRGR